jgi:hypothetical protein
MAVFRFVGKDGTDKPVVFVLNLMRCACVQSCCHSVHTFCETLHLLSEEFNLFCSVIVLNVFSERVIQIEGCEAIRIEGFEVIQIEGCEAI